MGLPGSLRTVFLLCLLVLGCTSVEGNNVDVNTLARIIQFFNNNYQKVETSGAVRQYAVAINVPEEQCQKDFVPDQNKFLKNEEADTVKNQTYNETVALYQGSELIAAGTLDRGKYKRHSESILMNPPKISPMTNLLNKKKDGCVVFYTYNSPCVDTCINEKSNFSILKMLEIWSTRKGLKAFAFKDIWKFDKKKDLKERFKAITKYVPLYRCVSAQTCYDCVQGDTINENCVKDNN
ncbi:uncharacterized protein LOC118823753 [Colossoma macropomum]|uniref:uncharacterized protein LOC118823753 n=1 Tax=Colossoma macropomum TaxID=42526 RepID=UPI001863E8B6|nr:uncharacterized protein LOC118823753 [Colossoma macropomum]